MREEEELREKEEQEKFIKKLKEISMNMHRALRRKTRPFVVSNSSVKDRKGQNIKVKISQNFNFLEL